MQAFGVQNNSHFGLRFKAAGLVGTSCFGSCCQKVCSTCHICSHGKLDRVEAFRCKSVGQVFGCIMASYTRSHQLDKKYLQQKGLRGHLVKQGANKRFLTVAEASTIMGTVGPLWLPEAEAFTFLGNGILPVHAALVIAKDQQVETRP